MIQKILPTFLLLFTGLTVWSQWTYKTIDSHFDGTFKKAYTQVNNGAFLAMEEGETPEEGSGLRKNPLLMLDGSYFCDDRLAVDLVLVVKGENKKYTFWVYKSRDSQILFFEESIWTEEFSAHFRSASKCLIRVNESHCGDEYFEFNMTGSTAAYNFMVK